MKPLPYIQRLRARRIRCKSQAFVEFAFILPIFLVMMMGVFEYSFMIMRMQVMAMAAREAANTATRQSATAGITIGLDAVYTAARSRGIDFSSSQGAAILTHVYYDSSILGSDTADVLLVNYANNDISSGNPAGDGPTNSVGGMGALLGTS